MFFNLFKKKPAPKESSTPPKGSVESPCDGVCSMDWANNICKSCYRTPSEIGNWDNMDDTGRMAVLAESKKRRP